MANLARPTTRNRLVAAPSVSPTRPHVSRAASGELWSSMALRIDPADSPLEREADDVATAVVQRKCAECEEEEEAKGKLQRRHDSMAGAVHDQLGTAAVEEVLSTDPGQPLDSRSRDFFEPRFNRDFSGVRIHTGAAASASARAIHARAYTAGSDVVFRQGEFAPQTAGGRALLAHELAHVVQQSGAVRRSTPQLQRKPASEDADPKAKSFTEVARDLCLSQVNESSSFWEGVHRDYIKPVEVVAGALTTAGKVTGGALLSSGMTLLKQIVPVLRHPILWVVPTVKSTADALSGLVWLYDNSDWMVQQIKTYVTPLITYAMADARSKTALGVLFAGLVLPQRLGDHIRGVHRHLDPMLESLASNWWDILTQAAIDLIWPWPTIWKELGTIWDLSKRFAADLCQLRVSQLIDHTIGIWRVLNQIAGLLWGYFAIIAVIIGAAIGAGGTPAGSLAGAGVGFALAAKVGTALLISTIAAELAAIGKAGYDLYDADEQEAAGNLSSDEQAALDDEKEEDYKQIAESTLTVSLIAVMFVVGQLASRMLSGLRGLLKAKPKVKPPAKSKGTGKSQKTTQPKTKPIKQGAPKKGPKKSTKKATPAPTKKKPASLPRNRKISEKIKARPDYKKLTGTQIAKLEGLPEAPKWPKDLDVPAALKGEPPYVWMKTPKGTLTVVRTPAGTKMKMPRVVYDPKRPEQFVNRSAYVKQKTKPTVPRDLEVGAADARRARGHVEGRQGESDAFASDPDNLLETKSGWTGDDKTIADVTDLQKRIGHTPEPSKALDQGVPGRHHSSHAEKKLATKTTNRRIGVSKEMCLDCQNFFAKLAVHEKQVIVVADPTGLRVFHPNYVTMLLEGASAIPAAEIAKQTEAFDADEVDYGEEDAFDEEEQGDGEEETTTDEEVSEPEPLVK